MAKLIRTDGSTKDLDNDSNLDALQEAVGGYIEQITLDGSRMIVNEEGLIHKLPTNEVASIIARRRIVGDVVLFEEKE